MSKTEKEICNVPFIGEIIWANPNIPDCIKDAYYSLVPQPKSIDQVSKGYVGKVNHYKQPYQSSCYGAYPNMWQLEILLSKISRNKEERYKHYQTTDVDRALKEYARGFQYGYDNFLKHKIDTENMLSNSESLKAQKIFDFISIPVINKGGFSEEHSFDKKTADYFAGWYDNGIDSGYNYRAWLLIVENYKLFESFFCERKKNKSQHSKQTQSTKYLNFVDIFNTTEWKMYIEVLVQVTPPLLNSQYEFISSRQGGKGVVCSWIKELQYKGIVKQGINRSQLATVLNTEIKNFNVGSDGKTFDNPSKKYNQYEQELKKLTGLLP